jgi:RHS repeat-associated protein
MEWYLSDHLGSTTLLVNESGLEVERTEYYPYGEVQSGGLEKYGFTGQENDADTGLMYYGARYYSPEYRVFVQPDTMLPYIYNPQALNRYSYCLNNPVKYTDPSGHFVVATFVVVGIVAVAAIGVFATFVSYGVQWVEADFDTSQISREKAHGDMSSAMIGSLTALLVTAGAFTGLTELGLGAAATDGLAVNGAVGGIASSASGQTAQVYDNYMDPEAGLFDNTIIDGNIGKVAGDAGVGVITVGIGTRVKSAASPVLTKVATKYPGLQEYAEAGEFIAEYAYENTISGAIVASKGLYRSISNWFSTSGGGNEKSDEELEN